MNEQKKSMIDSWACVELGDISFSPEKIKPADEPENIIKYLDIGGIDNDKNTVVSHKEYLGKDAPSRAQQLIKAGDVAFSTVRPYLKNIAMVPDYLDGAVGSTGFCFLRPYNGVESKYIFYWVISQNFINEISKHQKGSSYPAVTNKDVFSQTIPLPTTTTQRKIVEKIEELFSHIDAGVEGLKQAKAKLQQYRQSVLKDAVTGKLTEQWREQNAEKLEPANTLLDRILEERRANWEAEQLKAFEEKGKVPKNDKWKDKYKVVDPLTERDVAGLPLLPEGWCYAKLGQVIDDPKYGTSKKCTYDSKGKGVLRIPNIAAGEINPEDMKYAEFTDDEIATYKLNEGDILTIRSNGSVSLVGKCAVISDKDTELLFAGYLIRLRPVLKHIDANYLKDVLTSGFLRKQIEILAKSSSGVNNINTGELQSLIVPVCCLQEQRLIAQDIDLKNTTINRLFEEYDRLFKQASKNKSAILSKAFSGELIRHSSKESARNLLDKIKIEKEKISKIKSKHTTNRKKKVTSERRPLLTVLKELSEPVKPDKLMQLAGFSSHEVEEFYIELAEIAEQIEQLLPDEKQVKNWPYEKESEIKLKLKD